MVLIGFGDKALIDKLVAEFASQYNVKVDYNAADMSRPAEVAAMVAQAARDIGGVDIVVNNAGIQHVAPVEEFPAEKWDAVIAINLSAAFHAIRAALPHMKERNWGRIINIAATHGLVASAQKAAYVAGPHRHRLPEIGVAGDRHGQFDLAANPTLRRRVYRAFHVGPRPVGREPLEQGSPRSTRSRGRENGKSHPTEITGDRHGSKVNRDKT